MITSDRSVEQIAGWKKLNHPRESHHLTYFSLLCSPESLLFFAFFFSFKVSAATFVRGAVEIPFYLRIFYNTEDVPR